MKDLTVKAQVSLSPARTMSLTVAGIAVRLFRSLITVIILALAVTFLCHGLSHSLIVQESRYHAFQQLRAFREPSQWNTRLTTPDARTTIWANLAAEREPFVTEYARWAGADAATMERATAAVARLLDIQAYFDALPETASIVLLEGRTVITTLRRLADDQAMTAFQEKLTNLSQQPPPGGLDSLAAFIRDDLPVLLAFTEKARDGHRQAIQRIAQATDGELPLAWFADHESVIHDTVTQAGFEMDPTMAAALAEAGRDFVALEQIKTGLEYPKITTALVRRLNVDPRKLHVGLIADWLTSADRAEWLAGVMADALPDPPSAERLALAAEHYRTRSRLQAAVGDGEVEARGGLFDLPTNTRWLIMLSFLVCAVGVTNAMFMSVTERFTEIATMKCLGALDGFLMQMFVYESAIQGVVGALAGIILGIGLALLRGLLAYGGLALESLPLLDLLAGAGLSFLVGLLLAIVAGVGPALAVARLAPMEAMRIE